MTFGVAWLDTSPEEQRRTREVLRLFEQHESRDELGIGQVRDVLSDAMFPGFSVLHTRARYYLFIPWCFQSAVGRRSEHSHAEQAARQERILAQTLRPSGGGGVIGARMGAAVKTLPSTIYWNGMRTFGVLARDAAPTDLTGTVQTAAEADELVGRVVGDWHPTLPSRPDGFPRQVEGGFDLTSEEAAWLRERLVAGASGTLLGRLAQADRPPEPDSVIPWTDPAVLDVATDEVDETLRHAHAFSLVMHGASMLYLIVVAEAYAGAAFSDDFSVEPYTQRLGWWVDEVERERAVLDAWDENAFWRLIRSRNPRVSPHTERFVREWTGIVRSGHIADVLNKSTDLARRAPRLIERRERALKAGQSRLVNQRLLQAWGRADLGRQPLRESPPSGPQVTLTYRWSNVRTVLRDVFDGLDRGMLEGVADA